MTAAPRPTSRRAFLGGLAASLSVIGGVPGRAQSLPVGDGVTVDLHSHAGRLLAPRGATVSAPFEAVATPMRDGGMTALCLAIVADQPITRVTPERTIKQVREPGPGELVAWGEAAFARAKALIADQSLATVATVADLDACRTTGPGAIVTAEGADFLDGALSRLEDAYHRHFLRQLQLVHYRINELGDIQTEPPRHDGLTAFGADVIRACNRLGIVVDVAHGTRALVQQAVAVATRPLVLSHTSLDQAPGSRSRRISPEHARLVAQTGGVIGVWPVRGIFANLAAYADGFARMVEAAGVDHVGIGTDMLGLPGGSVFDDYRELPALAAALRTTGFAPDEIVKVLGGNYRRVFAAVVGSA